MAKISLHSGGRKGPESGMTPPLFCVAYVVVSGQQFLNVHLVRPNHL